MYLQYALYANILLSIIGIYYSYLNYKTKKEINNRIDELDTYVEKILDSNINLMDTIKNQKIQVVREEPKKNNFDSLKKVFSGPTLGRMMVDE